MCESWDRKRFRGAQSIPFDFWSLENETDATVWNVETGMLGGGGFGAGCK